MKWLKALFVFNRIDAICVFAAVWALVASYIYGGGSWYSQDLWSILLFCSSWAIGAAAGCNQISWPRAAALAMCQLFFFFMARSYFELQIGLELRDPNPENPLSNVSSLLVQWLFVGFVSFGLHVFLRMFFDWCGNKIAGKELRETSRFEILLYATVLIWFAHWISTNERSVMNEIGQMSLSNLARISLVSYVLAHCLTGGWSWVFVGVVFPALGLILFFRSSYELNFFWFVVGAVLLIASLIVVGSGVSRRPREDTDHAAVANNFGPSVWGLLPAAILVLFTISPNWMNIPTLFSRLDTEFWTRWDYSKANGEVLRSLDGVACWDRDYLTVVVDFADHSRNDRLELTSKRVSAGELSFGPWTGIRLKNIHPDVKTSLWSSSVSVHKGTLTASQISDLGSTNGLQLEDVSLKPGEKISTNLQMLYFTNTSPRNLKSFLEAFDSNIKPSWLVLDFPLTEDYWSIVIEASKKFSIGQLAMPPREFLRMATSTPETKLRLHHSHEFSIRELAEFPQVFEKSIPGLIVLLEDPAPLSPLETMMMTSKFKWVWRDIEVYLKPQDWNSDDLLVYERFESGRPKSVFLPALPDGNLNTDGLESLETLCLDRNWTIRDDHSYEMLMNANVFDSSILKKASKLKRLFIPWHCPVFDSTPLMKLKQLKELQVSWHLLEAKTGLEEFPELEKLTVFSNLIPDNTPKPKLPKLRVLTVVYDEGVLGNQKAKLIKQAKATFAKDYPNAKITIVEKSGFRIEIPDAFKFHFEKVTARLLKKLEKAVRQSQ